MLPNAMPDTTQSLRLGFPNWLLFSSQRAEKGRTKLEVHLRAWSGSCARRIRLRQELLITSQNTAGKHDRKVSGDVGSEA